MLLTGSNLIAGEESHKGTQVFSSIDPRTKRADSVRFYDATPEEIDAAAAAAAEAYVEIRAYSPEKLAAFLDRVAAEIEALGDDLIHTADRETALGLPRLTSERGRTTGQLRAFASLLREGSYVEAIIDTALPERQPAPRPDIRRMLFPMGPVAVFAASNFPFAFSVAGGDTASAWAAGCPVILKAHPGHPATSECVARAIYRAVVSAGFPRGFFSLVQGTSVDVGQALVKHPLVEAVGFTGSLRGGRALYDTAAARSKPIPVYAEMGSVNPLIVLPGAVRARGESIAEGLVTSATLGVGQFCTKPGLTFVINDENTPGFIERITGEMTLRQSGVLLNEHIEQGVTGSVSAAVVKHNVTVLTGGTHGNAHSFSYPNTIMQTTGEDFIQDEALQNEHFGPVMMLILCDSHEELTAALQALHGTLTATIHAEDSDMDQAQALFSLLREKAGRLIWNGYPTGVEVVYSMQHGGPYPATTSPATTSVGMTAIRRFMRPVAFQNMPETLLPDALKNANPRGIWRIVNGEHTKAAIG
jgi:NADP-dependent aldehyde dehydrogenase